MLQELVEPRNLGFIQELKQAKHQNQSQDHLALYILSTFGLIDEDEEMIYSSGEEDEEEGEWKIDDGDDIDDDFLDLDLDAYT